MKKILLIILMIVFYSNFSFSLSKKDALYECCEPLHWWSKDAGGWSGWMKSCKGKDNKKFAKEIKNEIGKLSWPDFKEFNSGYSKFASRYVAAKCIASEVERGKGYLNRYVSELTDLVVQETGQSKKIIRNENETKKEEKVEKNESIEKKLIDLKSLFEKKLITQDEYDLKRKEILDSM